MWAELQQQGEEGAEGQRLALGLLRQHSDGSPVRLAQDRPPDERLIDCRTADAQKFFANT